MILQDIDKSNWKLFRFDEICSSISEKVDPQNTDLDIYIGLEHLDKESLHIKRYGKRDDVKGAKLRCYPGDIIFGKRRAYQRKAAVVKFDGFCSAHAFVLRANSDNVDPNFFPIFLHSDLFMNRAIDISVGSLSPTINWGTLKKQEFLLPPKVQQEKIAELLWAMDEVIQKNHLIDTLYQNLLFSRLKKYFSANIIDHVRLDELIIGNPKYGLNTAATDFDDDTRLIRITDINDFGNLKDDLVSGKNMDERYILSYGDFLLARTADPGRSYYYKQNDGKCSYAGYLIKFELDLNKIKPEYLFYYTKTNEFRSWIKSTTRKGTISNINAKEFSSLKIPYISLPMQEDIIRIIENDFNILKKLKNKINGSELLHKVLINETLS